ncbi:MAG: Spy/CpxP family protein refolding chaperone [Nitrospina sp.]|jgi:Spy/CpxP family protein refolding chaperone|nr:Spy/CpxP family protein refolding chaperone [Nitrospina sp.]
MTRTKNLFVCALSGVMVLFFFQSAHAGLAAAAKTKESLTIQSPAMDAIGTGSAGSYSHGAAKSEGSKTKAYTHPPKKKEGSSKKSYSGHHGSKGGHSKHAYSSKHQKHHPSKSGHGYSKGGHSKQHYAKSSHGSHKSHSSKCFFSHLLNFRHKLQLSEAQVEDIQKLRFDYRKNSVTLKAEKEVAKMEFDRLVHGKTVDESGIRAAGEKIIVAKTKKIRAKVEAKIAVMKVLTDEQRAKVHKMHASH